MTYKKQMKEVGYDILYCYDDGRTQIVSENQDLYLIWLTEGNTPEILPYVPPTPPTPIPLEDLRMQCFYKCDNDLETEISSGYTFELSGTSYTFDTRPTSRERLNLAYNIALISPTYTQKMIMKDGQIVIMDAPQIIEKYRGMLTYGVPLYSEHADFFEVLKTADRTYLENYLNT